MIQSFRAWLPATALQADQLEERLSQAVGEWSRKWFARRPMRLRVAEAKGGAADRMPATDCAWHVLEEGLTLGVTPEAPSRIVANLLDLSSDEKLSASADEAVGARLAEGSLEDLRARLCRTLNLPDESVWRRDTLAGAADPVARTWAIGVGSEPPLIWLSADPELLVRLARLTVTAVPDVPDLRPLGEGLVRQPVRLSAFLGTCDLTLSQVASLTPGDVLVLDSVIGEPLELCVQPGDRAGRCVVERDDEQLQLKIVRPFFE